MTDEAFEAVMARAIAGEDIPNQEFIQFTPEQVESFAHLCRTKIGWKWKLDESARNIYCDPKSPP
jgi:hypothetical protein